MIPQCLLTLSVAAAVGMLFARLGVPGGMMIGAIAGAAVLNIVTGMAVMPSGARPIAQCLAGAFIGCSVNREDIRRMPHAFRPALVLLGAMLCLNFLLGVLIFFCSSMDLLTSLLCAVPGGMSDIPIVAVDLGADAPKVALLQFVRLSAGIGIFPTLIARVTRNEPGADMRAPVQSGRDGVAKHAACGLPAALTVAFLCGAVGKMLRLPAGTLVCAMAGVAAWKSCFGQVALPAWVKRLAQLLSGACIGCGVGWADVLELRHLVLPSIVLWTGYLLNSFLTGRLLHRMFGSPLNMSMLAATPAGASDMALISMDIGIDSKELTQLQIIRMIVVISVFPQLICTAAAWFG